MKTGRIISVSMVAMIFLITHCAKISSPAGGPKDTSPPVMVQSTPPQGTTMFRGKNISITFDEYFTLDRLNEKFLISPPLKDKPKVYTKGKSLEISFKGDLKDSTTYTLNFPDIIRDLNEGNPIANFQYVFSTGNTLDSLSVTGNVLLAQNLESDKNIQVMLYRNTADSAPKKLLPDYLAIADENGYFRINNLRSGTYKLYALSDGNNNIRYDLPEEKFAFLDSLIVVDPVSNYIPPPPAPKDTVAKKKNLKSAGTEKTTRNIPFYSGQHKLYLFIAEKKTRYLASSDRKMAFQLTYCLSLPPDTMKFEIRFADQDNYRYFTEKNKSGDSVTIWLRDSAFYSQPVIRTLVTYPFTDSTGKNLCKTDTVPMRYTMPKPVREKQTLKSLRITDNTVGGSIKPGQKVIFSSSTPLKPPDTSKIRLYHMKDKEKIPLPAFFVPDSVSTRIFYLKNSFMEGERYLFIRNKGSFSDIYGELSDSAGMTISVRNSNTFGHLTMDVRNGKSNLIVQLLGNKENVLQERKLVNAGIADFPLLEKGFYRIRIIYDLNGDGKWTTGNYDRRIQPEPVSYYPSEIEVRENFENVYEWDVSVLHFKEQALREKK